MLITTHNNMQITNHSTFIFEKRSAHFLSKTERGYMEGGSFVNKARQKQQLKSDCLL